MSKFYPSIYKILLISCFAFLFLTPEKIYAQEPTFFEGFDNTEMGDLPEGWSFYQKGGQIPTAHWGVSTYGFFGPKVAFSGIEGALEGMIDEDWLITPEITPLDGDFLIFDAAQTYTGIDYGTKYHVLISTATANAADFTDTLATFDETTFPKYFETRSFDLAAYINQPIHIAFVHETASTDPNQTDDWYLDNVYVRPVQPATFYQTQVSWQNAIPVPISETSYTPFLGFRVRIKGDEGVPKLSSLKLTTEGTDADIHIAKASLYTTKDVAFIAYWDGQVDAELFGEVENPADTFVIQGDQDLLIGDNYFWLTYSVESDETLEYPYPRIDASLYSVTIDEEAHLGAKDTVVVSPYIVPDVIPNDNRSDATEIGPVSGKYGSYNMRATAEPDIETLAYCADNGTYDNSNSIWWHFVAPAAGNVTVDLSESDFNTLLVFMDENSDQYACNNDIEPGVNVQSRIEGYYMEAGEEVYIRVTGTGDPGDPNGESGIVVMDFTFESLVSGVDDILESQSMSLPYPNPTTGTTSLDIKVKKSGAVKAELLDIFGRKVKTIYKGTPAVGEIETIQFDASPYPSGTYLIRLGNDEEVYGTQRLIINH
ncbi:T9SS-dependent choice-of-anchor J family protein [Fulvivirga ligni]|uniref:T9SS-dependent choice-of-anchor J family protein n=1 Tax=Fulvivirga ligni TaxID=2904246 RepID=UPI001F1BDB71|nr:choice-of-anchor J domain-containing protein [Fulvivirga ligni]UII23170.1 choice-of-anchor J domain-containing protein [Fulvivirga ligni]